MNTSTNKKTILWAGNFLSAKGGSRGVCEDLTERLMLKGYSVITASNRRNPILRFWDMVYTVFANRDKFSLAVLDVYSGKAFFWAEAVVLLLRILKKKHCLILRGGNLPDFSKKNPSRVSRILRSAKRVIAPSIYLVDEMRSYANKIELMPNPIDISIYPFFLRKTPALKLIWLRAFHAIYNPTLAISVLNQLQASLSGIHLTMIGPDKGDGSFQSVKKKTGKFALTKKIKFILGIPKLQVPGELNLGDIFINTTNIDNTPVSVIEAMACGLCVVSTNVGGIPYLLEHEKDALLVPPNDPEAMTSAIKRLFDEPGLAEKLSRNARKKAESFDWANILPLWEKVLSSEL